MPARRTKAELEIEVARLSTEAEVLRKFVFDLDLGQENANLEARRAALQEFLRDTRHYPNRLSLLSALTPAGTVRSQYGAGPGAG